MIQEMDQQVEEIENGESSQEKDQDDVGSSGVHEVDNDKDGVKSDLLVGLQSGQLSEWEARRYGSMAARLLRDVKIP